MSVPELRKREYPEKMVIGTLAGAATLGLMIPPSLTLIVYGVTINESITKLFMAGILPASCWPVSSWAISRSTRRSRRTTSRSPSRR